MALDWRRPPNCFPVHLGHSLYRTSGWNHHGFHSSSKPLTPPRSPSIIQYMRFHIVSSLWILQQTTWPPRPPNNASNPQRTIPFLYSSSAHYVHWCNLFFVTILLFLFSFFLDFLPAHLACYPYPYIANTVFRIGIAILWDAAWNLPRSPPT